MKLSFDIELYDITDDLIETPNGVVMYDGCTNQGIRVHIVANHLDHPIIWRNAIVFGTNSIEDWKK